MRTLRDCKGLGNLLVLWHDLSIETQSVLTVLDTARMAPKKFCFPQRAPCTSFDGEKRRHLRNYDCGGMLLSCCSLKVSVKREGGKEIEISMEFEIAAATNAHS